MGSVVSYARLGATDEITIILKIWKSQEIAISWLSPWINMIRSWEHQVPSHPGKSIICWNLLVEGPTVMSKVGPYHIWVRWSYSTFTGILLSCYKLDLLKCTTFVTLLLLHCWRGQKAGVLVWHVSPPVHLFRPDIAAGLVDMYGMYTRSRT